MASRNAVVRALPAPRVRPLDVLVAGVRAGEADAKRELFERFAPHLLRVLARVLGTTPELPDLLHDSFVEIYARIDSLREPERLPGWIVAVAVHVARHHLRRKRRRRWLWLFAPEELPDVASGEPSAEVRMALTELYGALGELDPDERIAFALRRIERMSIDEIADVTGASASTVKRRVERADAALRAGLPGRPHLASYLAEEGPNDV